MTVEVKEPKNEEKDQQESKIPSRSVFDKFLDLENDRPRTDVVTARSVVFGI